MHPPTSALHEPADVSQRPACTLVQPVAPHHAAHVDGGLLDTCPLHLLARRVHGAGKLRDDLTELNEAPGAAGVGFRLLLLRMRLERRLR